MAVELDDGDLGLFRVVADLRHLDDGIGSPAGYGVRA
jgi:hypothetical protein